MPVQLGLNVGCALRPSPANACMPLILHHSSSCDVCLDTYMSSDLNKQPHAIACGHIFCFQCLRELETCPLCRKQFHANKAKRLHVGRPENVDDHRETDLLQRLVVAWESPTEHLSQLLSEIDTWLAGRADDTCVTLRRSRRAWSHHINLKRENQEMQGTIVLLQEDLRQLQRYAESDRKQYEALENSWRLYYEQLSAQNRQLAGELDSLRSQIQSLQIHAGGPRHTASPKPVLARNPLPPPPEPIPTDHLPTLSQAVSAGMFGQPSDWLHRQHQPMSEAEDHRHRHGQRRSHKKSDKERGKESRRNKRSSKTRELSVIPTEDEGQPQISAGPSTSSTATVVGKTPGIPSISTSEADTYATSDGALADDPYSQNSDIYTLTSAYMQHHTEGYIEGQLAANGIQTTVSFTSTSNQEQSSERSSARRNRRREGRQQERLPSLISSISTGADAQPSHTDHGHRSSHRDSRRTESVTSYSAPAQGAPQVPMFMPSSLDRNITHPDLSTILTDSSARQSLHTAPVPSPHLSAPNISFLATNWSHSNNTNQASVSQSLLFAPDSQAQVISPTPMVPPSTSRNAPSHQPIVQSTRPSSPSGQSRRTHTSVTSWGTNLSGISHLTEGSLLFGSEQHRVRMFRGLPAGGDSHSQRTDGVSDRPSRRVSVVSSMSILNEEFSESPEQLPSSLGFGWTGRGSQGDGSGSGQGLGFVRSGSPVRPVESMVGVLPTVPAAPESIPPTGGLLFNPLTSGPGSNLSGSGPLPHPFRGAAGVPSAPSSVSSSSNGVRDFTQPSVQFDTNIFRSTTSMDVRPGHTASQSYSFATSGTARQRQHRGTQSQTYGRPGMGGRNDPFVVDEFGVAPNGRFGYETDVEGMAANDAYRRHASATVGREHRERTHREEGGNARERQREGGGREREREREREHDRERHHRDRPRERDRHNGPPPAREDHSRADRRPGLVSLPSSASSFPVSIEHSEEDQILLGDSNTRRGQIRESDTGTMRRRVHPMQDVDLEAGHGLSDQLSEMQISSAGPDHNALGLDLSSPPLTSASHPPQSAHAQRTAADELAQQQEARLRRLAYFERQRDALQGAS